MNRYFFKHVSKETCATQHHGCHFRYLFCEKSPEAMAETTHVLGEKRRFTLYLLLMIERELLTHALVCLTSTHAHQNDKG